MCRFTVHKIIPLCNFHLSAVQTCFWCGKFQLHFERWQDFSEEERQNSHSRLARNGNSCLPSGALCYRFALLPGERPELFTMWQCEEGQQKRHHWFHLSKVLHSPFWKTLGQSKAPIRCLSSPYNIDLCIFLLKLNVCGEYFSCPEAWIASEEGKIAREKDDVQEQTRSWLFNGSTLKLKIYHHGPNSQWGAHWEQGLAKQRSKYWNSNLQSN